MTDVRDRTHRFKNFLHNRFIKTNDLELTMLPNGMPGVTGEGSDIAYEGKYSYGSEGNERSAHFSFCFYTSTRSKDTRVRIYCTSTKQLRLDNFLESGLLKRVERRQNGTEYILEYGFVKDPEQMAPETIDSEVWNSTLKNVFAQIQSRS
ncbi:MAG: hypothetical protein RL557_38 [archaeon]|jgi:hypothetical protein